LSSGRKLRGGEEGTDGDPGGGGGEGAEALAGRSPPKSKFKKTQIF